MGPTTPSMIDHLAPNPQLQSQPRYISARLYFGLYDFNKSPMTPPETRLIVHDKPGNRT